MDLVSRRNAENQVNLIKECKRDEDEYIARKKKLEGKKKSERERGGGRERERDHTHFAKIFGNTTTRKIFGSFRSKELTTILDQLHLESIFIEILSKRINCDIFIINRINFLHHLMKARDWKQQFTYRKKYAIYHSINVKASSLSSTTLFLTSKKKKKMDFHDEEQSQKWSQLCITISLRYRIHWLWDRDEKGNILKEIWNRKKRQKWKYMYEENERNKGKANQKLSPMLRSWMKSFPKWRHSFDPVELHQVDVQLKYQKYLLRAKHDLER